MKLQTWLPGLIREKAIYERRETSEMKALVNETKSHDMNERQFRVWAPALVTRSYRQKFSSSSHLGLILSKIMVMKSGTDTLQPSKIAA